MIYTIWISVPSDYKKEISSLLTTLNDAYKTTGIKFEVCVREDYSHHDTPNDNHDVAIEQAIQKCRYFFMVFNNDVRKEPMMKEFSIALNQFRRTGKPLIFTYFLRFPVNKNEVNADNKANNGKSATGNSNENRDFTKTIRSTGQYINIYDHFESVKLDILSSILRNQERRAVSCPFYIKDDFTKDSIQFAQTQIREYMTRIKELDADGKSETNSSEIESLYNQAAKIVRQYCIELQALYDYVAFLYKRRDTDTAVELGKWLDKCYECKPGEEKNHSDIKTLLGKLYARQGRRDDAETLFRDAIELWPDNSAAHVALIHLLNSNDTVDFVFKNDTSKASGQLASKDSNHTTALSEPLSPYLGVEPYIFACYSHDDSTRVIPILNALHQRGYRVWYNEESEPASNWIDMTISRVNHCQTFLIFNSSSSLDSLDCRNELINAIKHNKPVISAYLDNVHLNRFLEMRLSIHPRIALDMETSIDDILEKFDYEPLLASCRERIAWQIDEKTYRTALALNPSDNSTRAKLGVLLSTQHGREYEAEQLLLEAILSDSGNNSFRKQLAQIYELTGRVSEADSLYQEIADFCENESTIAKLSRFCKRLIHRLKGFNP